MIYFITKSSLPVGRFQLSLKQIDVFISQLLTSYKPTRILHKKRIKYKKLLSVGQIASLRSSLPGRHRGCHHVRWMWNIIKTDSSQSKRNNPPPAFSLEPTSPKSTAPDHQFPFNRCLSERRGLRRRTPTVSEKRVLVCFLPWCAQTVARAASPYFPHQ